MRLRAKVRRLGFRLAIAALFANLLLASATAAATPTDIGGDPVLVCSPDGPRFAPWRDAGAPSTAPTHAACCHCLSCPPCQPLAFATDRDRFFADRGHPAAPQGWSAEPVARPSHGSSSPPEPRAPPHRR